MAAVPYITLGSFCCDLSKVTFLQPTFRPKGRKTENHRQQGKKNTTYRKLSSFGKRNVGAKTKEKMCEKWPGCYYIATKGLGGVW